MKTYLLIDGVHVYL